MEVAPENAVGIGRAHGEEDPAPVRHPARVRRRVAVEPRQSPERLPIRAGLGEVPDREEADAAGRIAAGEELRSVRRDLRRLRGALERERELSLDEARRLQTLLLLHGPRGRLDDEELVELLRRGAEDLSEGRLEPAKRARGHALPELGQARRSRPGGEPLEVGRADQIRHVLLEPAVAAVEVAVLRQLPGDREAAQHHRAEGRRRPSRARQSSLDQRGVAFEDPARRAEGDRAEGHRGEPREPARHAGPGPPEVNDVRHLVRRQRLGPVPELAEIGGGARRRRPQQDLRPVEEGRGRPVGDGGRVGDDDLDRPPGREADEGGDARVDRLELPGGVPGPGLERRREVDAEVRGLDRPPVGRRPLRRRRGRQSENQADEPAAAHRRKAISESLDRLPREKSRSTGEDDA